MNDKQHWEQIILDAAPPALSLGSLAVGDIDGDGCQEIVTGGVGALLWYRPSTQQSGQIAGQRSAGEQFSVGLALEDIDGDGHTMWHMVLHLAACQVRLSLWLGDVETAARWAECDPAVTQRQPPETLPRYLREVQQISRGRVRLARGDAAQVLATLDGLEEQAIAAGRRAQAIEACLLQALAWQTKGRMVDALASLERSLTWAAPEVYLEAGPDVIPLLRKAADQETLSPYVHRLLAAFGLDDPGVAASLHAGVQTTDC